jgi:large subunit ribosomal protein L5
MKLQEYYKKEIEPKLKAELGHENPFEIPRLTKAVINVGFGRHAKEKAYIDNVIDGLTRISGQKPVIAKAKKSISAFKIREGMPVGAKVTLRGKRMYDFVEKLVKVTFPRVRDFRGVKISVVDQSGNLNVGFKDNTPFPEIKADELENVYGLEVNLATTAKTREEGLKLFQLMGFPFKKEEK